MMSYIICQVVKTYYDGGELKEEYLVINNKIEGLYKKYHITKKLWIICNYVNGKINGDEYIYNENGNLLFTTTYIDGIENTSFIYLLNNTKMCFCYQK